jgi:hypothetical protein
MIHKDAPYHQINERFSRNTVETAINRSKVNKKTLWDNQPAGVRWSVHEPEPAIPSQSKPDK